MTKQEEENAPMAAPAESRAAPPPVLGYSLRQPAGTLITILGLASTSCATTTIGILFVLEFWLRRDVFVLEWVMLVSPLVGLASGCLGLFMRPRRTAITLIGVASNGVLLLFAAILVAIAGLPI